MGNDGITCCGDGLAFTGDGTENSVNISACGCPLGGTLIDETTCCHNGYVLRDGTQGEGGVVPHEANVALCGCPSGATFGTDNTTCCKNGRAYNADLSISSSNVVPSICGCPDGGEFGYDNETCCRRGYAWNMTTQSYIDLNTVCGCPQGGYLGRDNVTCCKTEGRLAWNGTAYTGDFYAEVCSCPSEYPTEGSCSGGHSVGSTTLGDGTICHKCEYPDNCPDEGCCMDGWAWNTDDQSYTLYDPELCGCPNSGEYQNNTCCWDGYVWDGSGYTGIDIAACGCPLPGQLINSTCCSEGKAWGGDSYDTESDACTGNCPEGAWLFEGGGDATDVPGCVCTTETPIWNGTRCIECQKDADCQDSEKPYCDGTTNLCTASCQDGKHRVHNYNSVSMVEDGWACCPENTYNAVDGQCCDKGGRVAENYSSSGDVIGMVCCYNPCGNVHTAALNGRCEPSVCKTANAVYANPSTGPALISGQCKIVEWVYTDGSGNFLRRHFGFCPYTHPNTRVITPTDRVGVGKCWTGSGNNFRDEGDCHFNEYFTM